MSRTTERMLQRDLFESGAGAARRPVGVELVVASALRWAPVVCAVGLFTQISLGGLRPALRESTRLDQLERSLVLRRAELVQDAERLELLRAAQTDPVYLERERRRRLDPAHAPVGAGPAD